MNNDEILSYAGITLTSTDIDGLKTVLKNLEEIPIADVRGGRQRTSKENGQIAIIRSILKHQS